MIEEAIKKIKNKIDLSEKETEGVFSLIMKGEVETEEIKDFLILLKEKKESIDEITGAARIMRKFATKITSKKEKLLDTCGTGGDAKDTFNISTVSAFVASGAGLAVAKHGNKAVSSKCGSADLLDALGVNIKIDKDKIGKCINEVGIGFLFAPSLHLAMKYAMPARKMIKTRSIFNILGPLTNPAGARYQILGVFERSLLSVMASVLKNLASERAMVVHGRDGLDEITTTCETYVAELKEGTIREYSIKPEDFGIKKASLEDIKGGDISKNVDIALRVLNGKKGPERDIVLLNAGASIYVTGLVDNLKDGIKKGEESIESGKALKKLEDLKKLTNKFK